MEKNSNSQQNGSQSVPIRTRNIRKYYRLIAEVGSGTYGRVYKAECLRTKQYVALKKFESKDDKIKEDGFPITAVREILLLKQLDHVNIIKLREIILSKPSEKNDYRGSTFLVFDYMDHDFAGLHRNKYEFSLQELKCIMKQILLGVQYLHYKKVIHRDLKIANILYNNQGEVKIADFGLARMLNPNNPKYTNKVVTLWYRAPELLLGAKEYTEQIDMWSVGCIFIELAIGENLLRGENEPRQLDKIYELCGSPNTQNWPEVDKLQLWKDMKPKRNFERKLREQVIERKKNVDYQFLNLLDGIMVLNPKKRFTVQQCLDHEFFKVEPLPYEISEMPKIKEECHEALLKNIKNRNQVIQSHKNNFMQRVNMSPSRIPPISTQNQQGQKSYSSSQNQSSNKQSTSTQQNASSSQQGNQIVGQSHFDSRNSGKSHFQQKQQSSSNNQQYSREHISNNKGGYYGNSNNSNSMKYTSGGAQQNIPLDSGPNLKKQGSSTVGQNQQQQYLNPPYKKKTSIQLSGDNNNDYPSIEHHLDNSNKSITTDSIVVQPSQSSKFNSFSGLASLVQKQGSVDRQVHIPLENSGHKKQVEDDDDEYENQSTNQFSKRQSNLSMLTNNVSSFMYSSNNSNNDDPIINHLSKINQKRSPPSEIYDINIKKKIKED
ncbi:hypothetical protein ABPG72_013290 [Tetrahymena utriculariae]